MIEESCPHLSQFNRRERSVPQRYFYDRKVMASSKLATASAQKLKVLQQKTLNHEAMENNLLEKQQYRLFYPNTGRHFFVLLSCLGVSQERFLPCR